MSTPSDSQLAALIEALPRYRRCIVTSHVNGEGDSFGSQLALAHLLRALGKEVHVINDSAVPDNLTFLPGIQALQLPGERLPAYDALFVVDVPVLERLGRVATIRDPAKPIIVIDHHVPQQPFGTINYIDPTAAAAGELVLRLYDALHVPIDRDAAVVLYVTLLTDTGSFRYSNTTATVHRLAARLIECGVEPAAIYREIYEHQTLNDLRLQALALQALHVTPDGLFSWIALSRQRQAEGHVSVESSESLIDLPRSLWGTAAVFVLRETEPALWRVSLRSKGALDVHQVAQQFGGGGHRAASGCTMRGDEVPVTQQLLTALRRQLPPPAHAA